MGFCAAEEKGFSFVFPDFVTDMINCLSPLITAQQKHPIVPCYYMISANNPEKIQIKGKKRGLEKSTFSQISLET